MKIRVTVSFFHKIRGKEIVKVDINKLNIHELTCGIKNGKICTE